MKVNLLIVVEKWFFLFEVSSIYFDGLIGTIFESLLFGFGDSLYATSFVLLCTCLRKLEHRLSNLVPYPGSAC